MLTPDLSQIHVDLTAIEHNMSVIRDLVGPQCAICPVLKADSDELRQSRLLLCHLTARTIRQGLNLLGIDVVQKM